MAYNTTLQLIVFIPKILSVWRCGILFMKKKSNLKTTLKNNGHDLVNKDICKYIGINSRWTLFRHTF